MHNDKKLPGEIELLDQHWDEDGVEDLIEQLRDLYSNLEEEEDDDR